MSEYVLFHFFKKYSKKEYGGSHLGHPMNVERCTKCLIKKNILQFLLGMIVFVESKYLNLMTYTNVERY